MIATFPSKRAWLTKSGRSVTFVVGNIDSLSRTISFMYPVSIIPSISIFFTFSYILSTNSFDAIPFI